MTIPPFKTYRVLKYEANPLWGYFGDRIEPFTPYEVTIEYKKWWGLLHGIKVLEYDLNQWVDYTKTIENWERHKEWSHILKQQEAK
jgi:hypothetical protein